MRRVLARRGSFILSVRLTKYEADDVEGAPAGVSAEDIGKVLPSR